MNDSGARAAWGENTFADDPLVTITCAPARKPTDAAVVWALGNSLALIRSIPGPLRP